MNSARGHVIVCVGAKLNIGWVSDIGLPGGAVDRRHHEHRLGDGPERKTTGVKVDAKSSRRQFAGIVISIQPWGYVLAFPPVRAAAV